jgi:hypothetical protein
MYCLYSFTHVDTTFETKKYNKRHTINLCIMLRFYFVCIICDKIKIIEKKYSIVQSRIGHLKEILEKERKNFLCE